jgi:ribosomal protein S18 acetylase RimI-like enzyme
MVMTVRQPSEAPEPEAPGRALPTETFVATSMTSDMITEVGKIHCEAFADYMNTRLGTAYVAAFLRWFLKQEQAIALVALDSKRKVLGYALGAPLEYGRQMNRDLLRVAAVSVSMRPWLLLNRGFWKIVVARLKSFFMLASARKSRFNFPEPAMSLIAIGVARSARGKKIGLCLLRAFEDKARTLGIRSLQLTVYSNNIIARQLYETNHWTPLQREPGENRVIEYVRILAGDENHRASGISG